MIWTDTEQNKQTYEWPTNTCKRHSTSLATGQTQMENHQVSLHSHWNAYNPNYREQTWVRMWRNWLIHCHGGLENGTQANLENGQPVPKMMEMYANIPNSTGSRQEVETAQRSIN